ncbi:expressed unknown protein [Seminavis robusta]|uniref:Uncharacterized protein n=1 Tax=Seminavis robusta TaxID=568900 RepID=A0A9N8HEU5_9STRA|nr:expressed unknown protein [Seminavis robusta]|eukprot:Sro426_g140500.1 n/a (259) ;mRNA; r:50983-51759
MRFICCPLFILSSIQVLRVPQANAFVSTPCHLVRRQGQFPDLSVPSHIKRPLLFSSSTNDDNEQEGEELSPERVAELIEVSFVNGVMQLSQGYVETIKLFIASVISGYSLGISPQRLMEYVAACPDQSANRPLMDEEIQLRSTWIQVVYLVLEQVGYLEKTEGDDDDGEEEVDASVRETYESAIPLLKQLKENGESFEGQKIFSKLSMEPPENPLEEALAAQSLKVAWLTLVVLEEEEQCLEDKKPTKPQPPIPGAFN